ncbi:MAG: hypothetical protein ACK4IX_10055, partial [Candidatus Sericytochromatia bacterium]
NVSSINKPIVSSLKESKFKIKEYYRGAPIGAVLFQYIDFYGNLQEEFRCPEDLYPPRNDPPSCGCGEQVEYDVYGHDLIINGSIAGYCQYSTNSRCVQKSQCGPVDNPDPDPTPIPEEDPPCNENAPPLLPEDINNLLQILGQYLLPDALNPVIDKVNNFTSNVNSANNLAGQYGFSTQETKEEKAKVKYDGFVDKINQSKQELLIESANLKTVASNILNEVKTKSNINKQLLSKEKDFNSYKLRVEELVDEFNYLITDENTFSLAEASAVYGQEVGLLANIIEDYANRVLPVKISNEEELEQYQDDENGFEKIQTTKGLIRYLKARIEGHKTRLDTITTNFVRNWNEYRSLNSEIDLIQADLNYIISVTDELLNLDGSKDDLSFSTQNFLTRGDEQGLPARDRMEIDRLRSWNSYAKQNLESTRVQYRDKYQELNNLKQIRDSGGKKAPNGDPINQAIKNVGKELNQLKTQIRSTNKTAKTSQKDLNTKINELNSCTKNNTCTKNLISITGDKYPKHNPNSYANKNYSESELKNKTDNNNPSI